MGDYGRRATTMTVLDRIPVSPDEGIVVRDISCRPDPRHRTDLGEPTWRLPLEPEATTEISLGFRVDTAKGAELRGNSPGRFHSRVRSAAAGTASPDSGGTRSNQG